MVRTSVNVICEGLFNWFMITITTSAVIKQIWKKNEKYRVKIKPIQQKIWTEFLSEQNRKYFIFFKVELWERVKL